MVVCARIDIGFGKSARLKRRRLFGMIPVVTTFVILLPLVLKRRGGVLGDYCLRL